jgi:hypothetical protein
MTAYSWSRAHNVLALGALLGGVGFIYFPDRAWPGRTPASEWTPERGAASLTRPFRKPSLPGRTEVVGFMTRKIRDLVALWVVLIAFEVLRVAFAVTAVDHGDAVGAAWWSNCSPLPGLGRSGVHTSEGPSRHGHSGS